MANESRTPEADADSVSRRTVIRSAAVAGVAAAGMGLAACSSDSGSSTGSGSAGSDAGGAASSVPDAGAVPDASAAPDAGTASEEPPADGGGGAAGGAAAGAIASTADIPLGGGKIVEADGKAIVVVQPAQGDFKAFSAVCPHQGCKVNDISDGIIKCPCHGSQFSAEDGSVKEGPAQSGLEKVSVQVQGDSIVSG